MSSGDLSALVIALREGIEMTLIAGIVLAYLTQIGARRAHRWAWAGIGTAVAVSVVFLGILNALNAEFQGATEQIFEGVTMLLAAGFLTWMVFWMLRQSRFLKGDLHRAVQETLAAGGAAWGIFFLVFFAVVREGVETALLLFAAPGAGKLFGTALGLTIAVGVGLLIYAFGRRIDLRTFFKVTGVLLVFFAAGLVTHAVHEFVEAGIIAGGPRLFDLSDVLPDSQGAGAVLRSLLGYSADPTILEGLVYAAYYVLALILWRSRIIDRIAAPRAAAKGV